MKLLNRIVLVNWYLIDAVEIPIQGNTAFVGPNASGKSSVLDAIQTVLLGGNKHWLAYNAGAGENNTRSLREYCLGIMYDPNLGEQFDSQMQPRQEAISHLALSFIDSETNEETCVGLCISASLSDASEKIEGRYIAPGMSAILRDFIKATPEGDQPRTWKELKKDLSKRFAKRIKFETTADRFIKELTAELSFDSRFPNDHQKFVKNFRNAILFQPIREPTDFIRRYILDDQPVQVARLRTELSNYRDIREKILQVKERINDLERIDKQCQDVQRLENDSRCYHWVAKEASFDFLEESIEPLRETIDEQKSEIKSLASLTEQLDKQLQGDREQLSQLKVQYGSSDAALQLDKLELQKERLHKEQSEIHQQLEIIQKQFQLSKQLTGFSEYLPQKLQSVLSEAAELVADDDTLLSQTWPEDPKAVDRQSKSIAKAITQYGPELQQIYHQQISQESQLLNKQKKLQQQSKQLDKGRAPLKEKTEALIALLKQHDIKATPLCDLVDVSDESWRSAIESYLGDNREALIVDPKLAREAVRLYRQQARHLTGCRIVNTLQTEKYASRCDQHSLAELVSSKNKHANAYINRMLGHVIQAESEQELMEHSRAVTKDGMLHANGSVTAMRNNKPILGRDARKEHLSQLQQQLEDNQQAQAAQKEKVASMARVMGYLAQLERDINQQEQSCTDLIHQRARIDQQLLDMQDTLAILQSKDDADLKLKVEKLQKKIAQQDQELKASRERREQLLQSSARYENELERLEAEQKTVAEQRKQAASSSVFDMARATELMEKLQQEYAELDTLASKANDKALSADKRAAARKQDILNAIANHQLNYKGRGDVEELEVDNESPDFFQLQQYVMESLQQLRDTGLMEYEAQAQRALTEAETVFHSEFVAQLKDRLEKVKSLIRELNNHLADRPFHGEYYTFQETPNPELAEVLKFIQDSSEEEQANVGGLFDTTHDPDSPHADAVSRISQVLQDEVDTGLLEDYRNYFNFDVKMKDAEGNLRSNLSYRLKKGSGGENQSPFYVAIGAALASTYRIQQTQDDLKGGMALAVFDEAFSKLDILNSKNCLNFLSDINLQTIIAAPDEKYALMSEQMDTIVNICREGRALQIDPEYITAEGRALLLKDDPLHELAADDAAPSAGSSPDDNKNVTPA